MSVSTTNMTTTPGGIGLAASATATAASEFTEANRKYWSDNAANVMEAPWVQELGKKIETFLLDHLDWAGLSAQADASSESSSSSSSAKLLDYACGHGRISEIYLPYVGQARGLDLAEGMVELYNSKARAAGLSQDRMYAAVCDLLTTSPEEVVTTTSTSTTSNEEKEKSSKKGEKEKESWKDFDLVGISGALHHVTDPLELAKKLFARLKPGGAMVVVEFLPSQFTVSESDAGHHHHHHHHGHGHEHAHAHAHGGEQGASHSHSHPASHTIKTHGFSEQDLIELLTAAGFEDVKAEALAEPTSVPENVSSSGKMHPVFARGSKPRLLAGAARSH